MAGGGFVALLLRLLTDDFGGMCVAIHGEQGEESRNLERGRRAIPCRVPGAGLHPKPLGGNGG